jgi:hypothetical protein
MAMGPSGAQCQEWPCRWLPAVRFCFCFCEWAGSWKQVITIYRELQWDRRQPARTWSREHGSWRIYGVGSDYQTTTGEDIADWENLVRAVVNCRMYALAIALQLHVVTICKCSVNPFTRPSHVYSHSYTWLYVTSFHYSRRQWLYTIQFIYACEIFQYASCFTLFCLFPFLRKESGLLKWPWCCL